MVGVTANGSSVLMGCWRLDRRRVFVAIVFPTARGVQGNKKSPVYTNNILSAISLGERKDAVGGSDQVGAIESDACASRTEKGSESDTEHPGRASRPLWSGASLRSQSVDWFLVAGPGTRVNPKPNPLGGFRRKGLTLLFRACGCIVKCRSGVIKIYYRKDRGNFSCRFGGLFPPCFLPEVLDRSASSRPVPPYFVGLLTRVSYNF